jgi:HSP20 family protein
VERWDPFSTLSDIQGEMNRLFDSFFGRPVRVGTGERLWAPAVDVYEIKDELVVSVELPGVNEKEIQVTMTGDRLTIRGERSHERDTKEENYHRLERFFGKFERNIPVPIPVQADKIRATYRNGVLEIHLPKADEVKPKEIKIDVM